MVVDGKKYGPHPFVTPLRDPKTHLPYPGVIIGDCGPKNGLNNIDNGYIIFNKYRIPKDYALDKFSGVDDSGKFRAKVDNPDKLFGLYLSPLSGGRAYLSFNANSIIINSLAVAIRFVCRRRQFGKETTEQLLIDYPSMRNRLVPYLAQAFVYAFGGINMARAYDFNMKEVLDPKSKLIEELHAYSGTCKAKTTWFAIKAIT